MLWITGAEGLLGSAVCAECKTALHVKSGREINVGNAASVRTFVKNHPGITHIVNCAAFSGVDTAEEKKEEAFSTNVIGPENLARIAKEIGAKFIHISTDYVFPGNLKRPLTEEDPVGPCNYYGLTKLEGEKRALTLSACVIRTSWIFGHGGKSFISKLLQMLLTQKEICLTNDQWGRFTYAPDLARAILQMIGRVGLYQYANAGIATKYEFGLEMRKEARFLGFPVVTKSIIPVPGATFPAPCKRPAYSAFDSQKIESFVTIRHWREALRNFLCVQRPVYL